MLHSISEIVLFRAEYLQAYTNMLPKNGLEAVVLPRSYLSRIDE